MEAVQFMKLEADPRNPGEFDGFHLLRFEVETLQDVIHFRGDHPETTGVRCAFASATGASRLRMRCGIGTVCDLGLGAEW